MIFMPNNLRVSKIRLVGRKKDWVTGIFLPSSALIIAESQTLALIAVLVMSEYGKHGFFAKTSSVLPVDHYAARENHAMFIGLKRDREVLPVDEIAADGMAPMHRSPDCVMWMILIEKMIFPFVIH